MKTKTVPCSFCGEPVGRAYHSCKEARVYRDALLSRKNATPYSADDITEALKRVDNGEERSMIVNAVNSHKELLAVLKQVAVWAESNCVNVASLELLVKHAIAKAEGK